MTLSNIYIRENWEILAEKGDQLDDEFWVDIQEDSYIVLLELDDSAKLSKLEDKDALYHKLIGYSNHKPEENDIYDYPLAGLKLIVKEVDDYTRRILTLVYHDA